VEVLFFAALEKGTAAERAAYLDAACEGDAELRRQVEKLLDAHPRAGDFLEKPVGEQLAAAPEQSGGTQDFDASADGQRAVPAGRTDLFPARTDAEGSGDDHESNLDFLQPSIRPDSLGRLGHFEVLQVLGQGGFGIVFRALDEQLQRVVAVKVLAPHLAVTSPARKRFLREARASAKIRHENVVQIHAVAEQPLPYLVMEFIPGETLQQRLDRTGPLEVMEVVHIGRQIAEGLAAAHGTGLIHRDIKPANILIEAGPNHHVKITDFGLARAADDATLTASGIVAGTPMFMAPEQAQGSTLDHRADLFSLGSVLYTICSGRPPFRADGTLAILKRVVEDTPRPIPEIIPEVPQWLCEIIRRLHAKEPADRIGTASEVVDLLERGLAAPQHPGTLKASQVAAPATMEKMPPSQETTEVTPALRRPGFRTRRWVATAALLLMLAGGLGIAEATGVTDFRGTVIRLFSPEGTLVVEVDDPGVSVNIDGADIVITGAGAKEIRLKPGRYTLEASQDGKLVRRELVTVTRNGRQVVRINQETLPAGTSVARAGGKESDPRNSLPPMFRNVIGMEFVLVPKGKRWLGGTKDGPGFDEVEIPAHFYLGKYEVTQEEWMNVMGEYPSHFSRNNSGMDAVKDINDADLKRFPVEQVSWDHCQVFIERLNRREKETGWVYRLPKEAEWEYACRGGPQSDGPEFDFYFAKPTNTPMPGQANFKETGLNRTCKVGSYEVNALGLHDMHGNVLEWCDDTDPAPDGSLQRVLRGGGFLTSSGWCRAADRGRLPPSGAGSSIGLRLARVPVGPALESGAKEKSFGARP
jgi:serine/threonine protein kinase/formylglycine-generating enzyme required for sulfatase activity